MKTNRINSRQKGARGERLWRDVLKKEGYQARRGQQFSGIGDSPDVVHNIPEVHFEVKCVEKLDLYAAVAQAERDAESQEIRVVAHKKNRETWLCTLPAHDFFILLKSYVLLKQEGIKISRQLNECNKE